MRLACGCGGGVPSGSRRSARLLFSPCTRVEARRSTGFNPVGLRHGPGLPPAVALKHAARGCDAVLRRLTGRAGGLCPL
jgi:hypothetical protein